MIDTQWSWALFRARAWMAVTRYAHKRIRAIVGAEMQRACGDVAAEVNGVPVADMTFEADPESMARIIHPVVKA